MIALRRILFALALALSFALPGVGGEGDGGENGGGTGVWVLPRAGFLTGPGPAPRATIMASAAQDVVLQMSADVGVSTAVFTDELAQLPVGLSVTGLLVRVPSSLMQSLAASPTRSAMIVIADAAQLGYVIQVTANLDGTVLLRVH